MKNNVLKITFLISLLLHIIAGFTLYALLDKVETAQNEEKKVKLSFKRGGDSAIENSDFKENTSISQRQLREIMEGAQSAQPSPQSAPKMAKDSKPQENKSEKSFDLASLELYKAPNLMPQNAQNAPNSQSMPNSSANLSQMLQNLPSEQRQEIMDLYGDELGDYGEAERDFIINNLRDIGRITQYYLNLRGYPPDAGYLRQQGKNAVEFYLHPNGDISELNIIIESKSMILDKNTLKTIQIAYKDYPRPTTKTKIRIYVKYYIYF